MAQSDQHSSLKESVLEMLRREIITGAITPGTPIRDSELAERYGVSTSPIREALVQLAADRLVEMPANRPKRVAMLDADWARDFFAVYKVVALSGFAWGAPRVGPPHVERLEAAVRSLKDAFCEKDRYRLVRLAHECFLPVYEAAGNSELLHMIYRRLSGIDWLLYRSTLFSDANLLEPLEQIVLRLLEGDSSGAIRIHFDLLNQLEGEVRHAI